MPIRRGVVYEAPHDHDVDGWLVVTNDDWNDHMSDVGAIPLALYGSLPAPPPHSAALRIGLDRYVAVTGALTSVDRDNDLGAVVGVVADDDLRAVQGALIDLLDLRPLLASPPSAPAVAAGPSSPMWAEIYYGPPRGEGSMRQRKRYVVVSNNHWNVAEVGQVLCVRTTTSERRGGPGFPEIQGGRGRACVGNMTAVRIGALATRERPSPPRLALQDMARIARDVVETFQLRL